MGQFGTQRACESDGVITALLIFATPEAGVAGTIGRVVMGLSSLLIHPHSRYGVTHAAYLALFGDRSVAPCASPDGLRAWRRYVSID